MTVTVTDESTSQSATPASVRSYDIEMGVLRRDVRGGEADAEREVGGGDGGGEGVVLEVPRSPLSSGLPRSPTLVNVYVGHVDKP